MPTQQLPTLVLYLTQKHMTYWQVLIALEMLSQQSTTIIKILFALLQSVLGGRKVESALSMLTQQPSTLLDVFPHFLQ